MPQESEARAALEEAQQDKAALEQELSEAGRLGDERDQALARQAELKGQLEQWEAKASASMRTRGQLSLALGEVK